MKLPAGTTTISGQSGQSLKRSPAPGTRQRRSFVPTAIHAIAGCAAVVPMERTATPETTASRAKVVIAIGLLPLLF